MRRTTAAETGTAKPRPALFRALGRREPPEEIEIDGRLYRIVEVFKHDSWAATACYASGASKIVCKFNRRASILGLPAGWIGRRLAAREANHYRRLEGLPNVPKLLGAVKAEGIVRFDAVAHEYVAGRPLRRRDDVSDRFFPELFELFGTLHAKGMAYVDSHKRENILVGDDGKPYLIDFQVSWMTVADATRRGPWARRVLRELGAMDLYHLRKHVERLRPDQLETLGIARLGRPWWIGLHRGIAAPLRELRRRLLVLLGVRRGEGRATSESFSEDAVRRERGELGAS